VKWITGQEKMKVQGLAFYPSVLHWLEQILMWLGNFPRRSYFGISIKNFDARM